MVTSDMVKQAERNIRGGSFEDGWQANNEYRRDLRLLNDAGHARRAFSYVAFLYGWGIAIVIAALVYIYGWGGLGHPNTEYALAACVGLIGLGWWLNKSSAAAFVRAQADFDQKWKNGNA